MSTQMEICPTSFGAKFDNVNDDTTAIQACLNTAKAGMLVRYPPGVAKVSSTMLFPSGVAMRGAGDSDGGTVFRVSSSANLRLPVFASADWYNNATFSGHPVSMSDFLIDGNGGTTGANAHGLVAMNFWSLFERISFKNMAGDGFQFTAFNRSGCHLSNTCVEPKISRLQVRNVGGVGIHIRDDGTTLNSCTDGFIEDCIVQSAGSYGISVEMAPGWVIDKNHIYGTGLDGIFAQRCYATRAMTNYIDGYGSGNATFVGGISMDCIDGRGSVCKGNVIGFEGGTATGPYHGIRITGKGSARTVVNVSDNMINGGSQPRSIGLVYQSQGSQIGHPFVVYSNNNDVANVATTSFIDGAVLIS